MPPHMPQECYDFFRTATLPIATSPPMWVEGAIIVGAGPSGMAVAACLRESGVSGSIVLEKSNCIGSLWQNRTYDRLCLHIPKRFCELPMCSYPESFPEYPTRQQFLDYLDDYGRRFNIQPRFNERVQSARFDHRLKLWRVQTAISSSESSSEPELLCEYLSRWLIVATGENAEATIPEYTGLSTFRGSVKHSSEYKNGFDYKGKRVLVVGSGNSGMEIALDLVQHKAQPTIVVRSPIHILPREMLGVSTFAVAMKLLKHLPVWLTDRMLVWYASVVLGDTAEYGIKRPMIGPMEMKEKLGRTPVLDVGTLSKIKTGHIKVMPSVECFTTTGSKFVNGQQCEFDAVIFATGYSSNVPRWLKGEESCFSTDGFPNCGWRGQRGLYIAGMAKKGILGASKDAKLIAEDIRCDYVAQSLHKNIK